jgi:NADPH2:quinone reductase
VKYRLEAARVTADAGAEMVVPHSLGLTCKTTTADGKTWGSYAEFMRVPATNVSPMPKSLNFAQAAAIPVASLTSFQALFHAEKGGGMIPGQKALIHGAAGGIGSFAVQFAKVADLSA